MKTDMSKPVCVGSASIKKCSAGSKVSVCEIKLKVISAEERERLRIPSYQYLLP